ncbi:MAG TPA: thiol-disulfide oxidoreductase DCC family protein [Nitrospiria bacterium]|jgi:predicted DCC family thiol-disulfide oxidoreductase YuxK
MTNENFLTPLILFDGVCNLCTGTTIFLIKRDKQKHFKLALMQSPLGQKLLADFGLPQKDFTTFVLVTHEGHFTKSTAVLKIIKEMPGGWSLLYSFIIIPKPIRDWVYEFVAKNRFRFFGRRQTCLVPTEDIKDRFLDG